MNKFLVLVMAMITAAACGRTTEAPASGGSGPPANVPLSALPKISTKSILEHIKVLSADEFEGRAPGTPGEDRTVEYLVNEFKELGLKPGNTDGTYIQKVPLVGITPEPTQPLTITKGGQKRTFKWKDDM